MNNFRDKIRGLTGLHTALEGLLTTINQIPVNGGGSSGDDYSTDEKVIGTWVDGKPLYRKVVNVTSPLNNGWGTVTNIGELDTMVSAKAFLFHSGSNYYLPLPYYENSNLYALVLYYKNGNVSVNINGNAFFSKPITLIVEYTKTTD